MTNRMAKGSALEDDYEAKLAAYYAKADQLEEAERVLVKESNDDDAFWHSLVARYDRALETRDEAGIAAYFTGAKAFNETDCAQACLGRG